MKRIKKRPGVTFRLAALGLLTAGLVIAICGNMLGGTWGTAILLVGLGIAGLGGAMAADGIGI